MAENTGETPIQQLEQRAETPETPAAIPESPAQSEVLPPAEAPVKSETVTQQEAPDLPETPNQKRFRDSFISITNDAKSKLADLRQRAGEKLGALKQNDQFVAGAKQTAVGVGIGLVMERLKLRYTPNKDFSNLAQDVAVGLGYNALINHFERTMPHAKKSDFMISSLFEIFGRNQRTRLDTFLPEKPVSKKSWIKHRIDESVDEYNARMKLPRGSVDRQINPLRLVNPVVVSGFRNMVAGFQQL
ncbi:hypothetical protein A2Z33_03950 [Candidatus Gottesmanbacteria bacterium RBG_16_52_11]|uniref:Uncharacterized protein n=1 Tax=Candidatus Gottesmanbacteria bacterium RBG_16_52_11 TaxID=1798374 RepID=A0A1F5YVX7_9BACT|nr:MAG: hypothetical protein A2Z33_03950 [Candidatus Gottesmanbacteria bacterium RBG_16_52_11]